MIKLEGLAGKKADSRTVEALNRLVAFLGAPPEGSFDASTLGEIGLKLEDGKFALKDDDTAPKAEFRGTYGGGTRVIVTNVELGALQVEHGERCANLEAAFDAFDLIGTLGGLNENSDVESIIKRQQKGSSHSGNDNPMLRSFRSVATKFVAQQKELVALRKEKLDLSAHKAQGEKVLTTPYPVSQVKSSPGQYCGEHRIMLTPGVDPATVSFYGDGYLVNLKDAIAAYDVRRPLETENKNLRKVCGEAEVLTLGDLRELLERRDVIAENDGNRMSKPYLTQAIGEMIESIADEKAQG